MPIKFFISFLIGLFLSVASFAQKIDWVKTYENSGTIQVDSAGNIYLVTESVTTQPNWEISKINSDGNLSWHTSLFLQNGYIDDGSIELTLDQVGNLYGNISFFGDAEINLVSKNDTSLISKTSTEPNESPRDERVMTFKISKEGEFQWATVLKTYNYHHYYSNLVYDPYTNTLYHTGSYAYYLNSDQTKLQSIATDDVDLTPVVFFCGLDADTGKEKVLKNLHQGLAGSLIPLANQLAYCSSALNNSFWLQLTREGEIQQFEPSSSYLESDELTGTDVRSPFFYQAGSSMTMDPIYGGYDHHNKIRKLDLRGNVVAEKKYAVWRDLYQNTNRVFSGFGIKSLDENNLMALATGAFSNSEFNTVEFEGETLTENDSRFILFDEELNIKKKYSLHASSYIYALSFEYSKKDQAFYVLFKTRKRTKINVGGRSLNIGGTKPSYCLIKFRFEDLEFATDQNQVLSLLVNQQTKSSKVDPVNRMVTVFVGPGTDLAKLDAKLYISENAKLKDAFPVPIDLRSPKQVTVISKTGRENSWTIQVHKDYGTGNRIELIQVPGQIQVRKDTLNREIDVLVERSSDLKNLGFSKFEISKHASVSPNPYSLRDFSEIQRFTVTAENGAQADWKIRITRQLSSENKILDFALNDQLQPSKINDIDRIIDVELAPYADWLNMIKHITLSPGAEIIPSPQEPLDFSKEVHLIVKAEDGSIENWTIQAKKIILSDLKQAVKIYPLPADKTLTVDLQFLERTPAQVELITIEGHKLLHQQSLLSSKERMTLDFSPYSSGVYLLKIIHANQVHVQKILIQH